MHDYDIHYASSTSVKFIAIVFGFGIHALGRNQYDHIVKTNKSLKSFFSTPLIYRERN